MIILGILTCLNQNSNYFQIVTYSSSYRGKMVIFMHLLNCEILLRIFLCCFVGNLVNFTSGFMIIYACTRVKRTNEDGNNSK